MPLTTQSIHSENSFPAFLALRYQQLGAFSAVEHNAPVYHPYPQLSKIRAWYLGTSFPNAARSQSISATTGTYVFAGLLFISQLLDQSSAAQPSAKADLFKKLRATLTNILHRFEVIFQHLNMPPKIADSIFVLRCLSIRTSLRE